MSEAPKVKPRPCERHAWVGDKDGHACKMCEAKGRHEWTPIPQGHKCSECEWRRHFGEDIAPREFIGLFQAPDGNWRCSVITLDGKKTTEEVVAESHSPVIAAGSLRQQMMRRFGKALV